MNLKPEPSTTTEKARRRIIVHRLIKWGCYTLYLAALLELVLQIFYFVGNRSLLFRRHAVPIYRTDEHMGFGVKRNLEFHHVTGEFDIMLYTNEDGFRTSASREKHELPKPSSKFRVLLMGPSFAFGWGVNHEATVAHLLQNRLVDTRLTGGREIEVINAGVPAIPLPNQLNWFEQIGRSYAPDLVVQLIYGGMWTGDLHVLNTSRVDEEGYLRRSNARWRDVLISKAKNFATVYYGWVVWNQWHANSYTPAETSPAGTGRELVQTKNFDPSQATTQRALRYYSRLKTITEASNARLLVVHFPLSYVVHPADIHRWSHLGVRNITEQVAANEAFCTHLRSQEIDCLNLTKDLQEAAAHSDERLYYWLDIHWTPAGNRLVADLIARHLTRMSALRSAPE